VKLSARTLHLSDLFLGMAVLALVGGLSLNLLSFQTRHAEARRSVQALLAAQKLRRGEVPARLPTLPGAGEVELEALAGSARELGRALDRYETEALIRLLNAWSTRSAVGTLAMGLMGLGTLFLAFELARRMRTGGARTHHDAPPEPEREAGREDLEILLERWPAAVLLLDPQGRVEFANQPAEELLGGGWRELDSRELPLVREGREWTWDEGEALAGPGWHLKGRADQELHLQVLRLEHSGRLVLVLRPYRLALPPEPAESPLVSEPAESPLNPEPPQAPCNLPPELKDLTFREMEIFEMIVQGLNNREIADRLLISEGTVKSHVNRLLRKLDLRNRVQVLLYAANYDLIDAGELHA
jgi:DNA-binding CsgD family transcriptional regulator/PAS domain-containing protein